MLVQSTVFSFQEQMLTQKEQNKIENHQSIVQKMPSFCLAVYTVNQVWYRPVVPILEDDRTVGMCWNYRPEHKVIVDLRKAATIETKDLLKQMCLEGKYKADKNYCRPSRNPNHWRRLRITSAMSTIGSIISCKYARRNLRIYWAKNLPRSQIMNTEKQICYLLTRRGWTPQPGSKA